MPVDIQIQAAAELELRRRKRERAGTPAVSPQTVQPLPFVSDPSPGLGASGFPQPLRAGVQPAGAGGLAELVSQGFSAVGFDPTTDEQVAAQGLPGEGGLARGLGTAGQVAGNIVKGGISGPVHFGAGLIDALELALKGRTVDPIVEQAKGLVKFIPEQVETVGTALGAKRTDPRGKITGINQRTGLATREPITPTEEEVSGARRELREHPEGPLFALGLGRGAGKAIAKKAKPKPLRGGEKAKLPQITAVDQKLPQITEKPKIEPKIDVTPLETPKKPILARETIETKPGGIPKKEIAPKEAIIKEPSEGVPVVKVEPLKPKKVADPDKLSESTIKEKGELAARTESSESGISDLRTLHDAISMSKEGFDKSIQKKVSARFKEITKDKSLGPKVRREKRRQLKNLMTELQAEQSGIAIRETKAGNVKGAIRKAGIFVPKEFAEYKNFKDIKGRLSKDPTTAIQEMDGALTAEAKVKLKGQEGPAEKFVLRRTQKMMVMRNKFNSDISATFKNISKGLSKAQRKSAFNVLSKISRDGAKADPASLIKRREIGKITTDPKVVQFAQEARKVFDHLLEVQNEFRGKRNQSLIPRRDFYTPDVLKEATIWDKAQFWNKNPREIMTGPDLPDFIKPNKPFNPHELAKKGGLEGFEKVNDLGELLERYSNTASRDIFNTSIIQNNKAFSEQLRSMGFESNARYLEDWTAEAFTGVKAGLDRAFHVGKKASWVMTKFRTALNRSVFPLNFAWTATVQTSSAALTVARYGVKNSTLGAFDWFTNKSLRRDIAKNAYSFIIKQDKSSRITHQDIGVGSSGRVQFKRNKLQTAVDAANFMTEWVERHLTGWSVATGRRQGMKLGFKDEALWDYASDAGAKSQSLYNFEDAVPILRNEIVKTGAPFQTFSFTLWNTMKEFAGKSGTPPASFKQRAGMTLRFAAAVSALNYIGSVTTGREPWNMRGFIPFYNLLFGVLEQKITDDPAAFGSTRELPAPIGIAVQLSDGIEELITKGRWDKLRKWLLKYGTAMFGIPGGTQLEKTVDGIIVISEGGEHDAAGRMKFPVTEVDDQLIAITIGKWATPGGQAYLDKRANERKKLANAFLNPNPIELLLDENTDSTSSAPFKSIKPTRKKKSTIRRR